MAAPMATSEPKAGNAESAKVKLAQAMDLIEQALPDLGSESTDGQAALSALRVLTRVMGDKKPKADELQRAEIMNLLNSLPQAAGASPEARAMMQAPVPGAALPAPPAPTPPGAGPLPGAPGM